MKFTKAQLDDYRVRLEELKKQHTAALRGTAQEVTSPDEARGVSQHHADEGTDDFGRTISIEVSYREMSVLKQINRALQKIDEGTYGVCDVSGADIPLNRLDAIPYATMTVIAQEQMEKEVL